MQITDTKVIDRYYQALLDRNPSYLGSFYVAVKTTSIFCISTCRARKPKLKNVDFFTDLQEVLQQGYRPCKICKPTEVMHDPPEYIQQAMMLVSQHPKEKISDQRLRNERISPSAVRRWFQRHYGITYQAYQRMLRINEAFQELKNGKSTTAVAYDQGYESLSGFGYTFKKLMGKSPQKSTAKNIIQLTRIQTPLGPMFLGATQQGVCLFEFTDRRMLETEFRDLQAKLNAKILMGENQHIVEARRQVEEYFLGKREAFNLPLDAPGTPFQQKVWKELQSIEYGTTRSYQEQAIQINQRRAVRAVAAANGQNRISIIIPCHRVIGKDGSLTGYGGGLQRKKWLLDFEEKNKAQREQREESITSSALPT